MVALFSVINDETFVILQNSDIFLFQLFEFSTTSFMAELISVNIMFIDQPFNFNTKSRSFNGILKIIVVLRLIIDVIN